ncbi:MAG: DUF2927 domain-containing protein [Pseudomonadota bacterium]
MTARVLAAALGALTLAACAEDTGALYRDHARYLQLDGLLRAEAAPPDAPFTNADLVRNFETIALNREYRREGEALVQERTASPISRWEQPVRYRIFGAGATAADRNEYAEFAQRITALTGLEVQEVDDEANVSILILDAEERERLIADLKKDGTAERMPLVVQWAEELRYPCVGQVGFADRATGRITGALIAMKAELEGLFRQSCIHEELTQALGLMNDDPTVRPSIFNDDQEFALLTEHDEFLLRILYDRRIKPGMEAEELRPILPAIVEELRPEEAPGS